MGDDDLVSVSVRELNKTIRILPKDQQQEIKQRRRTLKNREYAQTCRQRRVHQKDNLEKENGFLRKENESLQQQLQDMKVGYDDMKARYDDMKAKCIELELELQRVGKNHT